MCREGGGAGSYSTFVAICNVALNRFQFSTCSAAQAVHAVDMQCTCRVLTLVSAPRGA